MSQSRTKGKKRSKKTQRFDQVLLEAVVVFFIFMLIILTGPALKLIKSTSQAVNPRVVTLEEFKPIQTEQVDSSVLAKFHSPIPILMFHHIRNYDNPDDPINTNLSTPIANFESEMSVLKLNGYKTITFKNLLDGDIPKKAVILTFDDGYNDNYQNAYPILKANGQVGNFFVIAHFINGTNYLSAKQVKAMSENGMEIDSHTETHLDLTKLSSAELEYQIVQSKKDIEAMTGVPIVAFCYPSGATDATVEDMVRTAGYKIAVTTQNKATSNDLLIMPRVRMNPEDSGFDIIYKINNFLANNNQISWNY